MLHWLQPLSRLRPFDDQLKATSIPNRLEGEFVLRVEEWVQLFSDGLSNGKLPEAKSWLGVIRDAENDKQMGEIVDDFKVSDAHYFLAEFPHASIYVHR